MPTLPLDEMGRGALLHMARTGEHLDLLPFWVERYGRAAMLEVRDSTGWTPLMLAARHSLAIVQCLLRDGGRGQIRLQDPEGRTALDHAMVEDAPPNIGITLILYGSPLSVPRWQTPELRAVVAMMLRYIGVAPVLIHAFTFRLFEIIRVVRHYYAPDPIPVPEAWREAVGIWARYRGDLQLLQACGQPDLPIVPGSSEELRIQAGLAACASRDETEAIAALAAACTALHVALAECTLEEERREREELDALMAEDLA